MSDQASNAQLFLDLHHGDTPLLLPNPWDIGSAKLLASFGFRALATTSGGHAATLGRLDGTVTQAEAMEHAIAIVAATDLPVSADLENGFADDPAGVAETARLAEAAGLAGFSIEDWSGEEIYDVGLARERVQAAAEAAHSGDAHLVLTARAENCLRGHPDVGDTITRLQAFQEAGADVVYAPFMSSADDIKQLVDSVDLPVNVLAIPSAPTVAELSEMGVKRISVGASFALAGIAALKRAATELLESGTYGYFKEVAEGVAARDEAFGR